MDYTEEPELDYTEEPELDYTEEPELDYTEESELDYTEEPTKYESLNQIKGPVTHHVNEEHVRFTTLPLNPLFHQ